MNSRDIKVEHILSYELAPVPTSLFDETTRKLHIAKSKSILKNKLQVEQSAHAPGQSDAIVRDGCHTLSCSLAKQGKCTRSCHKCCETCHK